MIRIMILDDDEMYLKKEKEITEHYFAEKNIDCTVTTYQNVEWFLLGLNNCASHSRYFSDELDAQIFYSKKEHMFTSGTICAKI